jgi:hypothetical protein
VDTSQIENGFAAFGLGASRVENDVAGMAMEAPRVESGATGFGLRASRVEYDVVGMAMKASPVESGATGFGLGASQRGNGPARFVVIALRQEGRVAALSVGVMRRREGADLIQEAKG